MDNLARLLIERQMERDQATARMLEPAATCMPAATATPEVNLAELHQAVLQLEAERDARAARLAELRHTLDVELRRSHLANLAKFYRPPCPPPEPLRVITSVCGRLSFPSFV